MHEISGGYISPPCLYTHLREIHVWRNRHFELYAIADEAIRQKTGARGLRAILEENLLDLMYDIPDKKDVTEIVIDAKVINDGKEPTYIKKRHRKSA